MEQKGFTLVELLAVMTIIGVIALIIVPIVSNARDKANITTMQIQEDLLELSGEDYFLSNRTLLPKTYAEENFVYLSTLVENGYIDKIYDFKEVLCDLDTSYVSVINSDIGDYVYAAHLECDNYASAGLWGEWSAWQAEPIGAEYNKQVQNTLYYNYRDQAIIDVWNDDAAWALGETPLQRIAENGDTRVVYRYKDIPAKWYARDYEGNYYSTAPAGYTYKDEDQTTYTSWSTWGNTNPANYTYREEETDTGVGYAEKKVSSYSYNCYCEENDAYKGTCTGSSSSCCGTYDSSCTMNAYGSYTGTNYYYKYWTGDNPSGPLIWYSNSGWTNHWPQSSPPTPTAGYTRYVYTYIGTATVYRYRNQKWQWYERDYYDDGVDGYSITEPAGYSYRDDSQVEEVSWIEEAAGEVILVNPTDFFYREEESKTQTLEYSATYGDPILDNYYSEDDFAVSESMTVTEADASDNYDILSQTMYRYRTR